MKFYIESKRRVSGTNEDFVFQLPRGVDLPASNAYVDCVLVPNVIYSVRSGFNDKLYIREGLVSSAGASPVFTFRVVTITPGQYNGVTLAQQVQLALNSGTTLGANTYTVTYEVEKAKLSISTTAPHTSSFTIYGESRMPDVWNSNAPNYLITIQPQSANKVCGFMTADTITGSAGNPVVGPDVIDVQRHHCMYIHNDIGNPDQTFGPRGETDIIRRVIVDAPQNALAIDRHTTAHDYVDVPAQPLKSMHFSLRGSDGHIVDLHGHEWSFSLIFHEKI